MQRALDLFGCVIIYPLSRSKAPELRLERRLSPPRRTEAMSMPAPMDDKLVFIAWVAHFVVSFLGFWKEGSDNFVYNRIRDGGNRSKRLCRCVI